MPGARSQQETFVDEVLAGLFHAETEKFCDLLRRDGTRFLRFYWHVAGKKFPQQERLDPFGLNYLIRQPKPALTIILVTLPRPRIHGEAYYAGLVYRPQRKLLLVSDTSSFYSLEAVHPEETPDATALVEWTRRMQRLKLRDGVAATLDAFYQAVCADLGE